MKKIVRYLVAKSKHITKIVKSKLSNKKMVEIWLPTNLNSSLSNINNRDCVQ